MASGQELWREGGEGESGSGGRGGGEGGVEGGSEGGLRGGGEMAVAAAARESTRVAGDERK